YRRLSNLRMSCLMSRSVGSKRLGDEAPAGWTTYGTSCVDFHCFRASPRDMKAPIKINDPWISNNCFAPIGAPASSQAGVGGEPFPENADSHACPLGRGRSTCATVYLKSIGNYSLF